MLIFCKRFLINGKKSAPFKQKQQKKRHSECIHTVYIMTFSDHMLWPKELWAAVLTPEHRPLCFHSQVARWVACQNSARATLHLCWSTATPEDKNFSPGPPSPSALLGSLALHLRTVLYIISCRLHIFKWVWILWITEQQQEQNKINLQKPVSLSQVLYSPWTDFSTISFLNFY